jgi:hypothetical protein
MSKTIIENAGSQLYVYIPELGSINYYDKDGLDVLAINNKVTLRYNNGASSFFSKPLTEIDTPSTTPPNSLPDMVKLIHSWIISGTSTSDSDIHTATYTLTNAQILSSYSTPIVLVSGVAGKQLQVVSAGAYLKFHSVAYATNTSLALGTTSNPDGQATLNFLAASADTRSVFAIVEGDTTSNLHTGENLVISTRSGNPTAGDGQVQLNVMYRIIDLS